MDLPEQDSLGNDFPCLQWEDYPYRVEGEHGQSYYLVLPNTQVACALCREPVSRSLHGLNYHYRFCPFKDRFEDCIKFRHCPPRARPNTKFLPHVNLDAEFFMSGRTKDTVVAVGARIRRKRRKKRAMRRDDSSSDASSRTPAWPPLKTVRCSSRSASSSPPLEKKKAASGNKASAVEGKGKASPRTGFEIVPGTKAILSGVSLPKTFSPMTAAGAAPTTAEAEDSDNTGHKVLFDEFIRHIMKTKARLRKTKVNVKLEPPDEIVNSKESSWDENAEEEEEEEGEENQVSSSDSSEEEEESLHHSVEEAQVNTADDTIEEEAQEEEEMASMVVDEEKEDGLTKVVSHPSKKKKKGSQASVETSKSPEKSTKKSAIKKQKATSAKSKKAMSGQDPADTSISRRYPKRK